MPRPNLNLRHSNPQTDQRYHAHWSAANAQVCGHCEILFDDDLFRRSRSLWNGKTICAQCETELARQRVEIGNSRQDGALQVYEPDWRPRQKEGSAWELCACGNLMTRTSVKCQDCISDERHAQTRPGPKHIRKVKA